LNGLSCPPSRPNRQPALHLTLSAAAIEEQAGSAVLALLARIELLHKRRQQIGQRRIVLIRSLIVG
jgi:hypothetical protein